MVHKKLISVLFALASTAFAAEDALPDASEYHEICAE